LDDPEAIPMIAPLLRDGEFEVRWRAAEALGRLNARSEIPGLLRLLQAEDESDRSSAIGALIALKAGDAATHLVPLLEDPEPYVRSACVTALGVLGTPPVAEKLIPLLEDARASVRYEAAQALCRLGSDKGVPLVIGVAERGGFIRKGYYAYSDLSPLNALREPNVWERLGSSSLREDLSGPRREVLERLARGAGLAMEADGVEWAGASVVSRRDGRTSLRDALSLALDGSSLEFILESDRIRFMERERALEFWKGWWKASAPKR